MRGANLVGSAGRAAAIALALVIGSMFAFETSATAKSSKDTIGVELNKLNAEGSACQAYFVFDNQSASDFRELKLDLIVFNSDEVVERRFAMDVAPLDSKKRTVKLFELKKMPCDKIGSLLINGVLECKQGTRSRKDCVDRLVPSSRVDVKLTK